MSRVWALRSGASAGVGVDAAVEIAEVDAWPWLSDCWVEEHPDSPNHNADKRPRVNKNFTF